MKHLIRPELARAAFVAALLFSFSVPIVAAGEALPSDPPQWIAASGTHRQRLERRFQVAAPARTARLRLCADYCRATVFLNSAPVLRLEPFGPLADLDVARHLRTGDNQIAIEFDPVGGPAAIAALLELNDGKEATTSLITDESWTSAAQQTPALTLGPVAPELWGIGTRPATIDPFDNYEQWRQALAGSGAGAPSFWTAPGFEVTLLRSALPEEGSWVSLAFDPKGRLTIAREDKGLLRTTLAADGLSVANVETINDDLLECRGLLYAYDALYANANNSKGLYRLRDANGDDRFDDVRLLREFPGGVGHGRNDLALGPDGRIYSIHGDSVEVPAADIVDTTSPFREARRGQKTSEGHLLRTDRDGTKWELISAGMRNPFGIAFHPSGDPFTYDADAEFDMGSPWYRPTRVLQLRSGADFGWRGVTGKWPPHFPDHPDNALPALDIGKGSPTAVTFGAGPAFPAPYQDALFILDWAYGRILAVHLAARGGGYRAQAETFLKGRPLNVTDLAFGPDGALYLVTGGRKTQSALYKVAYIGRPKPAAVVFQHEQACAERTAAARKVLRQLEALHRPGEAASIDIGWPHLNDADPVIRHTARIAVEHQPVERWRDRALAEDQTTAALEALLALARSADEPSCAPIVQRLLALDAGDLDLTQSLALVHLYSLCLGRAPASVAADKPKIVRQLDALFAQPQLAYPRLGPAGSGAQLQRELARLLAQLGSPTVVEKTVTSLLRSDVQEDRLQALFALRDVREGWTPESRRAYFETLNEGRHFLGGDGMPRFLTQIRENAVATLTDAEHEILADCITAPVESGGEDLTPPNRPLVKAWTSGDFEKLLAQQPPPGQAERGAAVFREALCANCHRVGIRGPAVGPDLTHVGGRFSRKDILDSILSPNQVVAENYRNVQVLMKDGRVLVGRVLSEGDYRSEKLRLAADPLRPSQVIEIDKREIEQFQLSETSPMPKGLLDTFSTSEILDLLAYLQAGAK